MKKLKIATRLDGISDIKLSEKAAIVTSMMDGNTDFQNPFPTIPNLITLNANFAAAIVKAENGSLSDTAHKNELREALLYAMKALASWVELNCQDNETILLTSGYHLRVNGLRGLIPVAPENVKVRNGIHSGEILVSFKRPQYATGFMVRYTYDLAGGIWTSTIPFTKVKHTIGGLVRGKEVWVQVCSFNTNGISEWGNAVMEMVK